jgi:hypothetical protein
MPPISHARCSLEVVPALLFSTPQGIVQQKEGYVRQDARENMIEMHVAVPAAPLATARHDSGSDAQRAPSRSHDIAVTFAEINREVRSTRLWVMACRSQLASRRRAAATSFGSGGREEFTHAA